MKVLMLSREGDGADIAMRMKQEGSDVRLWIQDPKEKENLDGLVPKVDDWISSLRWADLVVFDHNGLRSEKRRVLDRGVPAFGLGHAQRTFDMHGHSFDGFECAEALEKERKMSHGIISELGMGEPLESLEFKTIQEAIAHLKEHAVPHVLKPNTTGETDSAKTYVSEMEDNSDAIGWLETLPDRMKKGSVKSVEMEERAMGVEVGVSAWFNGSSFLEGVNINFEHKKLFNDELGQNTGEMGTAMYEEQRPNGDVKLFVETLEKMGDVLRDLDYRGQIDVNMIVNADGLHILEFTPRLGYPAAYIETELRDTSWSDLLYAIGAGEDLDFKTTADWAIGAILVGEGFPNWDLGKEKMGGLPILGVEEPYDHAHFYEAAKKKDRLLALGSYPLCATASGPTLKAAQAALYDDVIPDIHFPNAGYRTDIGAKVPAFLKKLNELGWGVRPY